MRRRVGTALVAVGLASTAFLGHPADARAQEKPKVAIPDAGVPQIMTMEGRFVRAAYNNEAYAILGYRLANLSVGEPWLLLEVGLTLRDGTPGYTLTPDKISLSTPDGKTLSLPTIEEYRKVDLRALKSREQVQRDSIDYFPPSATQPCAMLFYPEVNQPLPRQTVEMTNRRACLGRLYFDVPGGIVHGQYYLNLKFAGSELRVPFRILTKDEEKFLDKNYRDIKKQIDEAFKPKKQ